MGIEETKILRPARPAAAARRERGGTTLIKRRHSDEPASGRNRLELVARQPPTLK